MSGLPWLDPYDDEQAFPPPEHALEEPDGLLAVGGNLNPRRLVGVSFLRKIQIIVFLLVLIN